MFKEFSKEDKKLLNVEPNLDIESKTNSSGANYNFPRHLINDVSFFFPLRKFHFKFISFNRDCSIVNTVYRTLKTFP